MSDLVADLTTFGDFATEHEPALSYLRLELDATDLITEWSRCGELANFVASYLAGCFERPESAEMVVSTVLNELIENACKFSAGAGHPIAIHALYFGAALRLQVTNVATPDQSHALAQKLDELLTANLDELFARKLHEPPSGIGRGAGIGLLILIKDYSARIGARVLPRSPGLYDIDVQVTLPTSEIEQR